MRDVAEQVWSAGRAGWPDLDVSRAAMTRFLEPLEEPDVRNATDLYLACACAEAVPGALEAFEREFAKDLTKALKRVGPSSDDLEQLVRERLFTSAEGGPKIARYGGKGPLRLWLRVVASRTAQNARRKRTEQPVDDAILAAVVADAASPESKLVSASLVHAYKSAFETAFKELEPAERALLRLSIVDGLGIDAIAGVLKVHRATAARRIAIARARLGDLTKSRIMAQAGFSTTEFESAYRLIQSHLDLSIRRMFAEEVG